MTDVRTTAAPTAHRPARLLALDVLRGIAILGTLATKVWIFTDPAGMVGYLDGLGATPENARMWAERVLQQVAQGKFLGLLTVMFGVGLAIQRESARRGGRRWPGRYPVRAGLLFLDGLLNFVLVAEFDVLMGYAVTGLVVAYLLATSPRAQRRWLIGAATVHVLLLTLIAAALTLAPAEEGTAPSTLDPNPYADGSFWDLVLFRLDHVLAFRAEAILIFPMSIALFLVGARLYRAGVFAAEGTRIRRWLMVIGLGVAMPLDLGVGLAFGGDTVLFTRYGTAPFVALGIVAVVAEFYLRAGRVGFVGARLSEVGRTALSCYILQNLIAGILCYGWGFGSAARVSESARVPFTVAIYLAVAGAVVVFAHGWTRRFERGPVEWVWQRAARALGG